MNVVKLSRRNARRLPADSLAGCRRPTGLARNSLATTTMWNRFRLAQGNFSVVLASLQTSYSFSRLLTTSALIQLNTANTQAVSANFRLRYNYRPDSDLYVIYNVGTQFASLGAANPEQLRESRLAVKLTCSFTPSLEQILKTTNHSKEEP